MNVPIIEQYRNNLRRLCEKYSVDKLYVFGSILNDNFSSTSDIDFIVRFDTVDIERYADNYFNLKFALEALFKRKVDLLEEQAIKNPFFKKAVDKSKKLIYG